MRLGIVLAAVVVAGAALVYVATAAKGHSTAETLIRSDVQAQFSTQSVSCRSAGHEPKLSIQPIFACTVDGSAPDTRPAVDYRNETFTRCYIRTAGNQTVDVTRAFGVLSNDRGKTAPCF